jgi:hypothetical protein
LDSVIPSGLETYIRRCPGADAAWLLTIAPPGLNSPLGLKALEDPERDCK